MSPTWQRCAAVLACSVSLAAGVAASAQAATIPHSTGTGTGTIFTAVAHPQRPTRVQVHPRDTLIKIARHVYGKGKYWPALYDRNKHLIGTDPGHILPGMWLRVPKRPWRFHYTPPPPPHYTVTAHAGKPAPPPPPSYTGGNAQQEAQQVFGSQYSCAANIIVRESGWNVEASNPSTGAYGLPQALPGSKMASAGADWATSALTQLRWMLGYVNSLYGGACGAWAFWMSHGYY